MRFDQAILLFLDLAQARIEAHRQPGGFLEDRFKGIWRADRTNKGSGDRMVGLMPETATPEASQALSITRMVPLRLTAQIRSHHPEEAYRECLELAALVQECMLIEPVTNAEKPLLEAMVENGKYGPELLAISLSPGNLVPPGPVRSQQNLFAARSYVSGLVETNL